MAAAPCSSGTSDGWKPLGDPVQGRGEGPPRVRARRQAATGRWHLVRMAQRPREKRENWLLIKGEDAEARGPGEPDILEERPELGADRAHRRGGRGRSAGLVVEDRAGSGESRRPAPASGARSKARWPGFVQPTLATLRPSRPRASTGCTRSSSTAIACRRTCVDGRATLLTRNGLDWTGRFGAAVARSARRARPSRTAIIDGELVVETRRGASDFSALQADLASGRTDRFVFYAFDLPLPRRPRPARRRRCSSARRRSRGSWAPRTDCCASASTSRRRARSSCGTRAG